MSRWKTKVWAVVEPYFTGKEDAVLPEVQEINQGEFRKRETDIAQVFLTSSTLTQKTEFHLLSDANLDMSHC